MNVGPTQYFSDLNWLKAQIIQNLYSLAQRKCLLVLSAEQQSHYYL